MTVCLGVVWSKIPLSTEYGGFPVTTGMGRETSDVLTSVSSDSNEGENNVLPPTLGTLVFGFEISSRGWGVVNCLSVVWLMPLSMHRGLGRLTAARMEGGTSEAPTGVSNDPTEGERVLPPILETLMFGIEYSG